MRRAIVKKTLYFPSGKVALSCGREVQYEFYNQTTWVWSIPAPGGVKELLWTFGTRKKAGRHLKRDK